MIERVRDITITGTLWAGWLIFWLVVTRNAR